MKEVVKWAIIRGKYGSFRHRALIDTGTELVLMPRRMAIQAGIPLEGIDVGNIGLIGSNLDVEESMADIEIVGSGCRAKVKILVPTITEREKPEFIIGSRFLQATKAAIIYVDDHPVIHITDRKFHMLSRGGGAKYVPRKYTPILKAETSPVKKRRPTARPK